MIGKDEGKKDGRVRKIDEQNRGQEGEEKGGKRGKRGWKEDR